MRRTVLAILSAAGVALIGALPAAPAAASAPAESITVYVGSAAGTSGAARDGLRRDSAVATVEQAQEVLRAKKALNATILVDGATFRPTAPVQVTWSPPGGRLTLGTVGALAATTDCNTFEDNNPDLEYGMVLTADNVTIDNYVFQYCRNGGIRAMGTSGNRISGLIVKNSTFQRLGGYWQGGPGNGYGGIHATYADRIWVENNLFSNLRNSESPASMHGVYLANYTYNTTIYNNRFEQISGDAVRTRNRGDNTTVDLNKFWKVGAYAVFSDWRFNSEGCSTDGLFDRNQVGNTTFNNDRWNVDAQGSINPVRVRLWGHDTATNANLYGCASDPIVFGGNNAYVSSRPW
ncbi:right-handed parallel beta-helix repeat-containing protein [Asanoa siamensis]|uniref:Right handed beta helix domain-containing protein n=1 Tax=Asanoa siamensis TaxID=926357 RepID=A0ABQ4D318_9ACTN|nr:right-handed parallel beta-helix repeat-containing protein [Asanoa siamensis]GIF77924.1 hypothetical protein Asi02nite_74420 [Asanoa siamensis]